MDFYVSVESEGRPGTYREVLLAYGYGPEDEEWLHFSSGDFLTDWKLAMLKAAHVAGERGSETVGFNFSSTIDFWPSDSCEFKMVEREGWPAWERLSVLERARARGRRWQTLVEGDLRAYQFA